MKKIGILLESNRPVLNWQHRIILDVITDKRFELTLVLSNEKVKRKGSIKSFFITESLLRYQHYLEKKILNIHSVHRGLEELLKNDYKDCFVKYIKDSSSEYLSLLGIDLLIDLQHLTLHKIGLKGISFVLWQVHFFDSTIDKRGPIGFWEVLKRQEGIGAFLYQNDSSDASSGIKIAESYFNRAWSMSETKRIVQEGSVSMVVKALDEWYEGGEQFKNAHKYYLPKNSFPNLREIILYSYKFYSRVFEKILEKLKNRFFGIRPEKWSIFFGDGDFQNCSLKELKPYTMPGDEFWADPFLFRYQGIKYVFFENYSYHSKKGKISCGQVEDGKLVNVHDVLIKDYHLSFPFIFEENGEVYIMPESCENKRLEIYKATDFPTSWELCTTAFEGELVADPVFHTDEKNQKWLFINKQKDQSSPMNSELHIYKIDSYELRNLQPHNQNPVIIDARIARNGGKIIRSENKFYRPSQRNVEGIYGRALNINLIKKLNMYEYEEQVVRIYYPNFTKNLMAMHHLHQTNFGFVIDAAYRSL